MVLPSYSQKTELEEAKILSRQVIRLCQLSRYSEAIPLAQKALAIEEKVLGPEHPTVANSLDNLAGMYFNLGDYRKVEPLLKKALEIREKALGPEHPTVANSLDNLAGIHSNLGDYRKVEPLLKKALEIRERALGPEHPTVANSLDNLAGIYSNLGDYTKAELFSKRALDIREKILGPEDIAVAMSLNNLAGVYINLGDYGKVEPLLKRALEIREKRLGAEHPIVADTLNTLAKLYSNLADYAKLEPLLRKTLEIREKALGPEHPAVATSLDHLARLYSNLGDYAKVKSLLKRTLEIREKALGEDHIAVAISLNDLALVYINLGDYGKVEPLLRRALKIREKVLGPDHIAVAEGLNSLAKLYSNLGDYGTVETLLKRALKIREKTLGPGHPDVAITLNSLAHAYTDMGNYAKSEPLFQRALAIAIDASEPELLWHVQYGISALLSQQGHIDAAIFFGKQAVNTIQQMRAQISSIENDLKKSFLKDKQSVYKHLTKLLIVRGRLPEAQQVLLMLKEEEFFDFVRRNVTKDDPRTTTAAFNIIETDWLRRYQEVSGRAASIGWELSEIKRTKRSLRTWEQRAKIKALRADLEVSTRAFTRTLEELKASFARLNKKRYAELAKKQLDVDLRGLVRELGHGVVLIHYLVLEDSLRILLTTPEVLLAHEVSLKAKQLNHLIMVLRSHLQKPYRDPKGAAQTLYRYLIAPITKDLESVHARTLMVSLDGTLRYLPFAALHDGEHYLIERYALSIFTEASRDKIKDRPSEDWELAGFGMSRSSPGFKSLPAVPKELDWIIRKNENDLDGVFPGIIRMNEAFTQDVLTESLDDEYPVLHIASHFKFNPGNGLESFLLLGDGTRLSLDEIYRGDFNLSAVKLLTLSACQTGMGGRQADGREVEGFGALAQKKGAKGVLATLWSVADQSTGTVHAKVLPPV